MLQTSLRRVFHYDCAYVLLLCFCCYLIPFLGFLIADFFFIIHFSIQLSILISLLYFRFIVSFFLFRELFCKPHVKLIAPTAYVPFSVFVMTYSVYDMMRHRDVILHCRYSTVDNILRTVITSIFVGIYDCPVCLLHLFLSLHYIGGKNFVLFHAYSRLGSLNSNLACF